MFFYYDPTYILVIIGAVICMAASAHVNSTYRRYAQVRSRSGMTGKDAAERNPACERVCASSDQRCSGTCCEFRFYGSLAADYYRIIHEWKYSKSADQSRNFAVFGFSAVSDRDIAGRI